MRCVRINPLGQVVDVNPQPIDYKTCAFVLAEPPDVGFFEVPELEQLQQAFEFGATVVLTFGLLGFLIGRLVNFWR